MREYVYLGTAPSKTNPVQGRTRSDLVGRRCEAIFTPGGKTCICGRNGSMLVRFGDEEVVVVRRRLRRGGRNDRR
ncbi:MAG: hypothetical protein M1401_03395 [Chloroflexi bacterium]|nr:hypothetical protein [Chloroflexota bacterium]MCL5107912.1 hypothetical protein [Chloroflexota bacterium]